MRGNAEPMRYEPANTKTLKEVKDSVRQYLQVGKVYKLDRDLLYNKKERDNESEQWNKGKGKLKCIGINPHNVAFVNRKGLVETYVYQDVYKMIFGWGEYV